MPEEILERAIRSPHRLGQAMRRRRLALGLTQAECAALTHVSARWLSGLENGKPGCELGLVMDLAETLGLGLTVEVVEDAWSLAAMNPVADHPRPGWPQSSC